MLRKIRLQSLIFISSKHNYCILLYELYKTKKVTGKKIKLSFLMYTKNRKYIRIYK